MCGNDALLHPAIDKPAHNPVRRQGPVQRRRHCRRLLAQHDGTARVAAPAVLVTAAHVLTSGGVALPDSAGEAVALGGGVHVMFLMRGDVVVRLEGVFARRAGALDVAVIEEAGEARLAGTKPLPYALRGAAEGGIDHHSLLHFAEGRRELA